MNIAVSRPTGNRLTLDYVLDQLLADGIISPQHRAKLTKLIDATEQNQHPLIVVADQGWQSATKPAYPLSLEQLTRWLAGKCGQEYYRIDPLKIDVSKITGVISQAYARKLKILPINVTEKELTVGTCEPFFSEWEVELSRIARKKNIQL